MVVLCFFVTRVPAAPAGEQEGGKSRGEETPRERERAEEGGGAQSPGATAQARAPSSLPDFSPGSALPHQAACEPSPKEESLGSKRSTCKHTLGSPLACATASREDPGHMLQLPNVCSPLCASARRAGLDTSTAPAFHWHVIGPWAQVLGTSAAPAFTAGYVLGPWAQVHARALRALGDARSNGLQGPVVP